LFDAAIFHDALTGTIPSLTPLRAAKTPYSKFLASEWDEILRVNYTPVFEIARDVLNSLPASPTIEAILKSVIDAALEVVSTGILLKHDFMGRVYHKLLLRTTGQYYATYYTSIPAAWLLANLVFKTDNPSWKADFADLTELENFSVIDCACGSGTLLSASYNALKDKYILAGPESHNLSKLHKVLVENVISGWDVLDYAAHLTLTSLALHSTKTAIRKSNIYVVPAGVSQDGVVHLGSLDKLNPVLSFVGKGFAKHAALKGLDQTREQTIPERKYDVVIMNPPFSRSAKPNIKFGYSDTKSRKKMSTALKSLGKSLTHYHFDARAIGNAGLSPYFMFLAARLVKTGGRVAAVLPRSTLSGVSFAKVWEAYLRDFHLEYVISTFDTGDKSAGIDPWSFSENTNIGEVMVIARRRDQIAETERTLYVNLWRKPRNEVVSLLYSQQIIKKAETLKEGLLDGEFETIEAAGETAGVIYWINRSQLQENLLAPTVFAHPQSNQALLEARSAKGLVRLDTLATEYGYDIRWLKDAFKKISGSSTYRVVWGHQGAMNTLSLDDSYLGYGKPKRGQKSAGIFSRYSSDLLIAERPHLSTECSLAFLASRPVMGTAFWELRLRDQAYAPMLIVWLASTYGLMLYLSIATSSQGDIVKLKKEQMAELLVPDPKQFDQKVWATTYAKHASTPLGTYRQQFEAATQQQGVRYAIDGFVASQMGLPRMSKAQYELLASDPIITKERL
jgi:Eco57I restriction-modification methylase